MVRWIHSARPHPPGDCSCSRRRCQVQFPHSSCNNGAARAGAERPSPSCVPLVGVVSLNSPAVKQTRVFLTPTVVLYLFLWHTLTCIHAGWEVCQRVIEVRGRCWGWPSLWGVLNTFHYARSLRIIEEEEEKKCAPCDTHILIFYLCWDLNRSTCYTNPITQNPTQLTPTLKPSLNPETLLWSCGDQPKRPHFASRTSILVVSTLRTQGRPRTRADLQWVPW